MQFFFEIGNNSLAAKSVTGPDDISQKINALAHRAEGLLLGMQIQFKAGFEKFSNFAAPKLQPVFIAMKQKQVVHIAEIMPAFEPVLYELVGFIEVNIGKKLGSVVANGKAFVFGNAKKGFVFRNGSQKLFVALDGKIFRGILEYD